MRPENNRLYFQKQKSYSLSCGVCSLNNLIGTQYFTNQQLTLISNQLSGQSNGSYKSIFGGDYDVSVLIKALQQIQYSVRWLKKTQTIPNVLKIDLLKGLLINIESKSFGNYFKRLINISGRHWSCIKRIGDQFVLLDSLQQQPIYFKDIKEAEDYLEATRKQGGTILIIEVAKDEEPEQKQEFITQNIEN